MWVQPRNHGDRLPKPLMKGEGGIPKKTKVFPRILSIRQLLLPNSRQRPWLSMGEQKRQEGGGTGSPSPTCPSSDGPLAYMSFLRCYLLLCPQTLELLALEVNTHSRWYNSSILFWGCLLMGQNWSYQPRQQGACGHQCVARHRV